MIYIFVGKNTTKNLLSRYLRKGKNVQIQRFCVFTYIETAIGFPQRQQENQRPDRVARS